MKKIYSLLTLALFAVVISCTDDDLDPLNFKKVSKGTMLALRGDFLQAIYIDGVSGASFVPLITDGTDVITFEGEYLAEDPTTLESVDVYVEKEDGTRVLLKNYGTGTFGTSEDGRPIVTVSFTLAEILPKLDIPATFPLTEETTDMILDEYGAGIAIVTDLNLTDGTKVLADQMVAAGLYQSNSFYPAHRLTFDPVQYCRYDADSWGDFEIPALAATYNTLDFDPELDDPLGPYETTFTQDLVDENTYVISDLYYSNTPAPGGDVDATLTIEFGVSTSPYDQELTVTSTTIDLGDGPVAIEGGGTYNQCTGEITIDVTIGEGDDAYDRTFQLVKK